MTTITVRSEYSFEYALKELLSGGAGSGGVAAFAPSGRALAIRANAFADVLRNEAFIAHQTLTLLPNQRFVRFWFFVVIAS